MCWRRAIWSHHRIIYALIIKTNLFIDVINCLSLVFILVLSFVVDQMSSYRKLFFTDFVPSFFIRIKDSFDELTRLLHCLCWLTNNQYVLIIFVIRLWCWALFLRAFSSNEDLAFWLFLKTLLVMSLWAYQQSNIIDAGVFGYIHLLFDFSVVLKRVEDKWI